jgi:ParB-like chromosome segregation protein Spo0J
MEHLLQNRNFNDVPARTHSRKQIRQIAESIGRFGFTNPVLIDDENRILAGHGRVEAARERRMSTVPCLRVGHLSATEKRVYVLADNKLALSAGWDEELGLEPKELTESDVEFDVQLSGFSIAEVDQLVEGLAHEDVGFPIRTKLLRVAAGAISGRLVRIASCVVMRKIPLCSPP